MGVSRMDREPEKVHIRGKISEREGLTRQPSLLHGPETGIEYIRSKLVFNIFDEYANILKDIHSTRFSGSRKIMEPMTRRTPPQVDPNPPSSPLSKLDSLIPLHVKRRRRRRGLDSIKHTVENEMVYY